MHAFHLPLPSHCDNTLPAIPLLYRARHGGGNVCTLPSKLRSGDTDQSRFYNVNNGYVEGIVRGYRNTLLTGQSYGNLTQCETIDGALPPICLAQGILLILATQM